jgi:hypothetical protein
MYNVDELFLLQNEDGSLFIEIKIKKGTGPIKELN